MNFLAHLYLSKSNENIIIGNFIADAVKGKKYNNYPKEIKAGILLHREIDNYTDNHPIVKNLEAIKTEFVSSIDTINTPNIKKTILLEIYNNQNKRTKGVQVA